MPYPLVIVVSGAADAYDPLYKIESLTWAIGEEFTAAAGRLSTRLLADIVEGDTSATVESTYLFPSAGSVWIDGIEFSYTSKTDGTFDGLTATLPVIGNIGSGAEIVLNPFSVPADYGTDVFLSQVDRAFRDSTPGLAQGTNLQRVGTLYGLPIPVSLGADAQRAGQAIAAFAPRDRRQLLVQFLEGILAARNVTFSASLPAGTNTIVAAASTFATTDVGRWVRTSAGIHLITAVNGSGSTATLNRPSSGVYGLTGAQWATTTTETVTLLPFTITEDPQMPSTVTVWFWTISTDNTPGNYMQPASVWLAYNFETFAWAAGQTITGGLSGASGVISTLIDNGTEGALLLHDVSGTFLDNETLVGTNPDGSAGGSALANGTTGDQYIAYDGETGGGFAVGDTVTGDSSGTVGVIRGLQDDGATGFLIIERTANQTGAYYTDNEDLKVAGTKRGVANGDAQSLQRPDGQDAWGYLASGELVSQTGRRPLYLAGGDAEPDLQNLIQQMVAAGVYARARVGGWPELT